MEAEKKLMDILDGVHFKCIDNEASVEEFMEAAHHNWEQMDIIEARGERYQQRLFDFISLFLACKLQPLLISRFGDPSGHSLRRLFEEPSDSTWLKLELTRYKQLSRKAIDHVGLNIYQVEIISRAINEIIDEIPERLTLLIENVFSRMDVVPMQEAAGISEILMRMMKEGGHGNY